MCGKSGAFYLVSAMKDFDCEFDCSGSFTKEKKKIILFCLLFILSKKKRDYVNNKR